MRDRPSTTKPPSNRPASWSFAAALCVFVFLAPGVGTSLATDYYWDVNGATSGSGGTGNWGGASLWRVNSAGGSAGTWANGTGTNNAFLGGTAGTLTIDTSLATGVTLGTLDVSTSGYTIVSNANARPLNADSLVLGGNVGLTLNLNSSGGSWIVNNLTFGVGSTLNITGAATTANSNRITFNSAGATIGPGNIFLNSTTSALTGFVANAANVTLSADITNGNAESAVMLAAGTGASLTYGGVISGATNLQFSAGPSGGSGIVTLANNNTYTGGTYFFMAVSSVVRLGIDEALPSTSTMNLGNSAYGGTGAQSALDLNGFNQTVAGLLGVGRGIVNNAAGLSTLTVAAPSGSMTFGGVIGVPGTTTNITNANNNIRLYKTGDGTQILSGASTFTGGTTVLGGTLTLAGNNRLASTGAVAVAGGTLSLEGNSQAVSNLAMISGTISGTGSITSAAPYDVRSGVISVTLGGSVGLNKTTAGTVTLAGANTYGGATSIAAGTLIVNGSLASSTVSVAAVGTLQGSGTIAGIVDIATGGTLSPGNSVESLGVGGLTLTHGSNLVFEFRDAAGDTAGTDWDLIDLGAAGVLNLGDATADNPINLYVDSWKADNTNHGGGPGPDFNGFDPSQSYEWLFIKVGSLGNLAAVGDDDITRRFNLIDDEPNLGVFDTGSGNPFTRPSSSEGEGKFSVAWRNGVHGLGLYVQYSAVPEPGSMALATLASLGAGWYGRRRLRSGRASTNLAESR